MNRRSFLTIVVGLAFVAGIFFLVRDFGVKGPDSPGEERGLPAGPGAGEGAIASRAPVQEQGPTAPEKAREEALSKLEPGAVPAEYVPGQHQVSADDPRVKRVGNGEVHYVPMVELSRQLNDGDRSPVEDLEILDAVVGTYRSIYRENPVAGLNHEVTAVLAGKNEKNVVLIEPSHPAINELGELTDRWGTPYRFHGVSGQEMEFISAGPDRKFGSADDLELGKDS